MKGIIFTTLAEMVEEKFGLQTWDEILLELAPPSEGAYTAGALYPDSELFAIVTSLSQKSKMPISDLLSAYGEYLFEKLIGYFPNVVPATTDLKQFLTSIDSIIHVEVKKLHPNAELPSLKYEDPGPNQLVILYQSPRRLCALARGLIQGTAKHFHSAVDIKEPLCMHKGADHCRLELAFSQKTS